MAACRIEAIVACAKAYPDVSSVHARCDAVVAMIEAVRAGWQT